VRQTPEHYYTKVALSRGKRLYFAANLWSGKISTARHGPYDKIKEIRVQQIQVAQNGTSMLIGVYEEIQRFGQSSNGNLGGVKIGRRL
jgi:hypothetical protein